MVHQKRALAIGAIVASTVGFGAGSGHGGSAATTRTPTVSVSGSPSTDQTYLILASKLAADVGVIH